MEPLSQCEKYRAQHEAEYTACAQLVRTNHRECARLATRTAENGCPNGIPKHRIQPWKKIWENLVQWDDIIKNKNRIDRAAGPVQRGSRELTSICVREANTGLYLEGDFNRAGGPRAIERILSSLPQRLFVNS
jgi:hypothetical protein